MYTWLSVEWADVGDWEDGAGNIPGDAQQGVEEDAEGHHQQVQVVSPALHQLVLLPNNPNQTGHVPAYSNKYSKLKRLCRIFGSTNFLFRSRSRHLHFFISLLRKIKKGKIQEVTHNKLFPTTVRGYDTRYGKLDSHDSAVFFFRILLLKSYKKQYIQL